MLNKRVLNSIIRGITGVVFALAFHSTAYSQSDEADVAIVIDDSMGMCGYINAPDSEYRQLLERLQISLEGKPLKILLYTLSGLAAREAQLKKNVKNVKNVKTNAKQYEFADVKAVSQLQTLLTSSGCPFSFNTSPLDLMHKAGKAKLTLLISDMIFDSGNAGAVKSRLEFNGGLGSWNNSIELSGREPFYNASIGLIGFHSQFNGSYYPQDSNKKTVDFKNGVERPFYVFWKSLNNEFSKKVLLQLAGKTIEKKRAFALSLTPYPSLTENFEFPRPSALGELIAEPITPLPFFEYWSAKALGENEKNPKIIPSSCFSYGIGKNKISIKVDYRCGNKDIKGDTNFAAVDQLKNAVFVLPIKDNGLLQHAIAPLSTIGEQDAKIKYDYLDSNRLAKFSRKKDIAKLGPGNTKVLMIEIPRGNSFLNNMEIKKGIRTSDWKESFSTGQAGAFDGKLNPIFSEWSANTEPCIGCDDKVNKKTVDLDKLVKALLERLDASKSILKWQNDGAESRKIQLEIEKVIK